MKAKNCLIFGGSGQIGRHLIRKLTKNNYKVTVVTRNIHQKSYKIKTQANAGYIDSAAESAGISAQPGEYKNYLFSTDAMTFRFNNTTGHLEMVVF